MPASLYRLANKPHHAESHVVTNQTTQEAEVVQVVDAANVIVESEPQANESQDSQPAAGEAIEEISEPVVPSWDPNWTKTKLLDFALSLGLNVTSTNTKTEIINALTAATSK